MGGYNNRLWHLLVHFILNASLSTKLIVLGYLKWIRLLFQGLSLSSKWEPEITIARLKSIYSKENPEAQNPVTPHAIHWSGHGQTQMRWLNLQISPPLRRKLPPSPPHPIFESINYSNPSRQGIAFSSQFSPSSSSSPCDLFSLLSRSLIFLQEVKYEGRPCWGHKCVEVKGCLL
jgi:hypothetical protein